MTMTLVLSLVALRAPDARAQECRSQEIQVKISFWRGVELHRRDGTQIKLGMFGGGYESVFQDSERALASMRTYRSLRIVGMVTRLVGLAALATEIGLNVSGKTQFTDALSLSLLVAGVVLGIGGGFVAQAADSYASDAVQHYNADLARRQQPSAAHVFGLSYRGRF